MTSAFQAEAAHSRQAGSAASIGLGAITTAIGAAAALSTIWIGCSGDVTWLITANERWLAGERPYVDFIEFNPPASLMLYTPPVALARCLGVRSEFMVALWGFALIALALALGFAILRRAGKLRDFGAVPFIVTLIALTVLSGDAFMERDVAAAWFGLPFLALCWARADRAEVRARHALAAGVGVGLMIALKPPFALVALAPGLFVMARVGARPLLGAVEIPAAVAVLVVYAAVTQLGFPAYGAHVWPAVANVYLAVRQSVFELVHGEGGLNFLTLMLLSGFLARRDFQRPSIAIAGLAALGAFAGYVVQGKGWLYQAYPALAFAALFAGLAWDRSRPEGREPFVAGLAFGAALVLGVLVNRWGVALVVASFLGFGLRRLWIGAPVDPITALARIATAAALGVACSASMPGSQPPNALATALTRLGPHPTVMAVTESFGFVHPMVRRAGGVWVQSEPNMLITAAARVLMDQHPGDAALATKLTPYIEAEKQRLVADIVERRPDAILVGPLNTRFHAAIWSDPALMAAMTGYRLFAVNDPKHRPAQLWARRDLIDLRPTLAPEAAQ